VKNDPISSKRKLSDVKKIKNKRILSCLEADVKLCVGRNKLDVKLWREEKKNP